MLSRASGVFHDGWLQERGFLPSQAQLAAVCMSVTDADPTVGSLALGAIPMSRSSRVGEAQR